MREAILRVTLRYAYRDSLRLRLFSRLMRFSIRSYATLPLDACYAAAAAFTLMRALRHADIVT